MIMVDQLLAAFAIGLLGSTHCVAMCGGIAGALGMRSGAHGGSTAALSLDIAGYALGRITTYALLGVAVGSVGGIVTAWVPGASMLLRGIAAALLVVMGLYVSGLWTGLVRLERLGSRIWQRLAPRGLAQVADQPLLLGALWGMLPCGLVYSTLLWAASSGQPLQAGLDMFAFGLGTVPAVAASGALAGSLQRALATRSVRLVAGGLLVLFGIWTAAGPDLMGRMHGNGGVDAHQHGAASGAHTHQDSRDHGMPRP